MDADCQEYQTRQLITQEIAKGSSLDGDGTGFVQGSVGFDRDQARGHNSLTGADVESTIVEIALHVLAVYLAL